jgi:hypothetical protein
MVNSKACEELNTKVIKKVCFVAQNPPAVDPIKTSAIYLKGGARLPAWISLDLDELKGRF